jgi:formylglycine-generating enzyme required for sulfatase activity
MIVNSIGMKLVLVKPGVFLMGSPANEAEREDDEYQHEVEITQPFYAGSYPVIQEQYRRVMGENPSWFSSETRFSSETVKGVDMHLFPVESVSWKEAAEFCRRLSELPDKKTKELLALLYDTDADTKTKELLCRLPRWYRLPTEAEWEYICRNRSLV